MTKHALTGVTLKQILRILRAPVTFRIRAERLFVFPQPRGRREQRGPAALGDPARGSGGGSPAG